jgi:RNA polymerase sigma-70 factor (ECF subfamily)
MDAEDLVGDTTLKVLLNADRFDASKSFRLWVYTIMRNTWRNKCRNACVVEPFGDIPEAVVCYDPWKNTVHQESASIIEDYAKSSTCIMTALLYAKGYLYKEIADMQGVNINIVKSRIRQGRMAILKKLKPPNVSKR